MRKSRLGRSGSTSRLNFHFLFTFLSLKGSNWVLPIKLRNDELKRLVDDICHELDYITTVCVFLLTLINPSCIMSYDYINFLDCGINPLEESPYSVAPFIQEFFAQNNGLLGYNRVLTMHAIVSGAVKMISIFRRLSICTASTGGINADQGYLYDCGGISFGP